MWKQSVYLILMCKCKLSSVGFCFQFKGNRSLLTRKICLLPYNTQKIATTSYVFLVLQFDLLFAESGNDSSFSSVIKEQMPIKVIPCLIWINFVTKMTLPVEMKHLPYLGEKYILFHGFFYGYFVNITMNANKTHS